MDQTIGKTIRDDIKTWTFRFFGGSSFEIELKNQLNLVYGGTLTLWKFYGTKEQAYTIKEIAESYGCSVLLLMETVTPQQELIRRFRVGDFSALNQKGENHEEH